MPTYMREAKLILPTMDNDKKSILDVHSELITLLLETFGGFTRQHSSGAWLDPKTGERYQDQSVTYFVAGMADDYNNNHLHEIAANICVKAKQECVYIVDFYGTVNFIYPNEVP